MRENWKEQDSAGWAQEWLYGAEGNQREKKVLENRKGSRKSRMCLAVMLVALGALVLFAGISNCVTLPSYAKTEEATTEDAKSKYDKLKSDKETAKELLEAFQSEKKNIVSYIDKLDKKLNTLSDDISAMQKQEKKISAYLEQVQMQLEDDKRKEEQQYNAMKLRIKYLYEHGSNNYLDVISGSTSFGDMLNRSTYVSKIQEYDNSLLAQYRKALESISEKELLISQKNEELAQITVDLKTEKDTLEALVDDKSEELGYYNHNIKAAGVLIASYEKAIKEEEEKMRQAESAADDMTDEMYASLPSEYSGGKFLWPTPGCYTISSQFGYRIHPLTGTRRLHGGIDIACASGSSVYAGASGVVSISEYSSSAGNYIMINHGGGLSTVYMHNSKLLVKVGDHVKKGQRIALSGSTGWSTGPHLHFGVRKNGTYVNPIPYLKSTNTSDEEDYSEEPDDTETTSAQETDTNDNSKSKSDAEKVNEEDADTPPITKESDEETSNYVEEADDSGDKKDKSSDLKDDSDPDSE